MKKILFALLALALALGSSMPVYAATQATTMPVSLTLVPAVTVSATNLNFGSVVSGTLSATGNATINVNATNGLTYTVTLDAGLYYSAGYRYVRTGATLGGAYFLYKEAARTTQWGDAGFAGTFSSFSGVTGTGSGAAQTLTVYGTTFPGTTPGTFTDTVTVTVHY